jgi:hypothetical protein
MIAKRFSNQKHTPTCESLAIYWLSKLNARLPYKLNVYKHIFFFDSSRINSRFGYKRYIRSSYVQKIYKLAIYIILVDGFSLYPLI